MLRYSIKNFPQKNIRLTSDENFLRQKHDHRFSRHKIKDEGSFVS